tara:strand:- start:49 stop:243 length:195 start_codon:yes stop_codon:yes gene_type:complete
VLAMAIGSGLKFDLTHQLYLNMSSILVSPMDQDQSVASVSLKEKMTLAIVNKDQNRYHVMFGVI